MTEHPFAIAVPVYANVADDEDLLQSMEGMVLEDAWSHAVHRAGGTLAGPPTITREPNLHYGKGLTDRHGMPILDENGDPLIDTVKLHIVAKGWAIRGGKSNVD